MEAVRLPEPALGAERVTHDVDFVRLDDAFDTVRDTVNRGVDVLNELGLGLRRLPEESLRELVVLPLTGDYRRIRQNAEAVVHVDTALSVHARNVAGLALAIDPSWDGEAAAGLLLRLGRHAAATRAVGALVHLAVPVLEEIATFSERLAVEVERLVVELVERGRRLVTRLLARVLGPGAWVALAAEVALHGLEVVEDLVDDARRLIELVDRLVQLRGEVEGRVEDQRARLLALGEIAEVARAGLAA
ncbi:hypothetical protein E9934_07930 [Nocardioides caeni]|uniref:Uncharacterized protein n=1 Tax=Nocardioides caeni TaxID=574700 RepID=A0A4S8NDE6_9ACTN|nr:hypothetical protein [Nocardioides caeni]THV14590.1 hypothetical protein E9934_07930 [Nocardioides caeni]